MSSESIPIEDELKGLTRWASVALAVRCARRVLPLFRLVHPNATDEEVRTLEQAIALAERCAAQGRTLAGASSLHSKVVTLVRGDRLQDEAAQCIAEAVNSVTYLTLDDAGEEYWPYGVHDCMENTDKASPEDIRPFMRRDLEIVKEIVRLATSSYGKKVAQSAFGPLWPDGPPEGWPVDSTRTALPPLERAPETSQRPIQTTTPKPVPARESLLIDSGRASDRPVRVLLSYRHESREHADRVRDLSDRLRRDGVDAVIDRYVPAPAEGWSWWMETELRKADRVIVVCSEGYLASASREAGAGLGRGASWEWHLIRREVYDSRGAGERLTPVFFEAGGERLVPGELWDRPRYCLADPDGDDYRRLLNDLLRRPDVAAPPVGGPASPRGESPAVEPKGIRSTGAEGGEGKSPRVYISYTHDSLDHRTWVAELAERLYYDGVDVTFDYWFMEPGKDFWVCLEKEVDRADAAVLVCTPVYRAKAMGLQPGGLKREYDRLVSRSSAEPGFKIIPLVVEGDWNDAIPPEFASRFGFTLRRGPLDPNAYAELRRALLGRWRPGPPSEAS
jgi:hypothetical protein